MKDASHLPIQKGGGRKSVSLDEGGEGHNKFWGSSDTGHLSFTLSS